MKAKEAKARIKINKLLEAAGWRFFDDENQCFKSSSGICESRQSEVPVRNGNWNGQDADVCGSYPYVPAQWQRKPCVVSCGSN